MAYMSMSVRARVALTYHLIRYDLGDLFWLSNPADFDGRTMERIR